jgi:hypothetical protein
MLFDVNEGIKEDVTHKAQLIQDQIMSSLTDPVSLLEMEKWALALGMNIYEIYMKLFLFSPENVDILVDRIDQDIKNLMSLKKYITTAERLV